MQNFEYIGRYTARGLRCAVVVEREMMVRLYCVFYAIARGEGGGVFLFFYIFFQKVEQYSGEELSLALCRTRGQHQCVVLALAFPPDFYLFHVFKTCSFIHTQERERERIAISKQR